MRTIETTANVTQDGKLIAAVPTDIPAGNHPVILMIEDLPSIPESKSSKFPYNLKTIRLEGWPKDCTFRREDIYGDEGR